MPEKLCMPLVFSTLMVSRQLRAIIVDMRNLITKYRKILEICKNFIRNQVPLCINAGATTIAGIEKDNVSRANSRWRWQSSSHDTQGWATLPAHYLPCEGREVLMTKYQNRMF